MGNNKKGKCKASSPAESNRPAPSRPVSPVYQASSRCNTPDQGYTDHQYAQANLGYDSSEEQYDTQEDDHIGSNDDKTTQMCNTLAHVMFTTSPLPNPIGILFYTILGHLTETEPKHLTGLRRNKIVQQLIAQAVSEAKAPAPPPPPPPSPLPMEVSSPTTPKGPGPPGAMPPAQGNPTPPAPESGAPASATPPPPPAAPAPHGKPAPLQTPTAKHASKHTPPPPLPTQTAPRLSYAAALGSKAPRPRKAHLPTTLVAPASTKWVVIPNNKSQLWDAAKHPSSHHIVGAINRELCSWAGESIGRVQVANLGDSHILAATWMVGCNLLLTATKVRDDRGLATPAYSTIVGNALFTIPAFSNAGVTVIPYRPAARLQIKGLPTWDPTTNCPVELTLVYQTLDGLGIFEGVELIKNGPAPSDALSWTQDPKTFNAESCPCAVTVRFYNNNGRETEALLKKAFYLLGRQRRFNKWPPKPLPPKKG
ncbi:hypothetical protein H0H81_003287 [Sphagnurus paluster]|uniref:Uncharacterized protein n=1 Tax=Sphagnurus paluster TaxID=117069 RepID=A0A9P7KJD5_9AGAR|nr:hypothetical protein H0H81_003287 [Sphagnurus paluster]